MDKITKKYKKPDFVLAVLPYPATNIKTLIKFYLSTRYGIAVQCVVSSFVFRRASLNLSLFQKSDKIVKFNDQYCNNVALQ